MGAICGPIFRFWLRLTYFLVVTFLPLTNLVEVDELRIPIPGADPPIGPEKVFGANLRAHLRAL